MEDKNAITKACCLCRRTASPQSQCTAARQQANRYGLKNETMKNTRIITDGIDFSNEFAKCCNTYSNLEFYVAWIGDSNKVLPFEFLNRLTKIKATIGIDFNQSHPNGIRFLMDLNANVRIVNSEFKIFHPKIYIFNYQTKYCIFIGSSNLTYSGFYINAETNVMIETDEMEFVNDLKNDLKRYRNDKNSFIPTDNWINQYELDYQNTYKKNKENKIKTEHIREELEIANASWLKVASWDTYLSKLKKGFINHKNRHNEDYNDLTNFLNIYSSELELPWNIEIFETIEKRRMILGINPFGWLGHVGATGRIRHILANGTNNEKNTIVNNINAIGKLELPLDYKKLAEYIENLCKLGPTIKVWCRFLAIIRPDLYCTISSNNVQENLSNLLQVSKKSFETIERYIDLLKIIHVSPWFNQQKPNDKIEQDIWNKRVAFLDVIFY
ncbi:MAG: phospholipase D family protein [Saprospiraceae bacterium]